MKKLFLGLAFVVITTLLSSLALADSTVTFAWEPNFESDLAGYRLYQTEIKGEYTFGKDNAVAVIPAGTETVTLGTVKDGEKWWVLTAYDFAGNESGRSNEVTVVLDSTSPDKPSTLNVIVVVKVVVE